MNLAEVIIAAALAAIFGALVGDSISDNDWRKDCDKLGKHRSGVDVYVCKKEPT